MKSAPSVLKAPFRNSLTGRDGLISREWEEFFNGILKALTSLGVERFATIENNKSVDTPIEGLAFDSKFTSYAFVPYLIQRLTTGTGATELIEAGAFVCAFKPASDTWDLLYLGDEGPDDSGVDLAITSSGQVVYQSTDISGDPSISKIIYRPMLISAKNHQYSKAGGV